MSLEYRVLGGPARDNALFVRVNAGTSLRRLLFDCGERCLDGVRPYEVQAIDHLFFSHFHMDHVAGFDTFFRANYGRDWGPVHVWGPPGTIEILHHRFRGFVWNLYAEIPGEWFVHEIQPGGVRCARFLAREAFEHPHDEGSAPADGAVLEEETFQVSALALDHGIPSLAYLVREPKRRNIDLRRLAPLGLSPGPWLRYVKDPAPDEPQAIEGCGRRYGLGELREKLIVESPGDSLAYLTDFRLDRETEEKLAEALRDCRTIVCEGQYRAADRDLAHKNWHLTVADAARIARRARAERLVVFHVSGRYSEKDRAEMLAEARAIFERADYPPEWTEVGGPTAPLAHP